MMLLIMVLLLLASVSVVLSMAISSILSWIYERRPPKVRALETRLPSINADQVLFVALLCLLFSLAYFWGYTHGLFTAIEPRLDLGPGGIIRLPRRWSV